MKKFFWGSYPRILITAT